MMNTGPKVAEVWSSMPLDWLRDVARIRKSGDLELYNIVLLYLLSNYKTFIPR